MSRFCRLSVPVYLLTLAVIASASYVKDVSGLLRQRFNHKEFPNYKFYSTPVGNFGIGTFFSGSLTRGAVADVSSSWLIAEPNSWWAANMTGDDKKAEREKLLREIFPDGPMGSVDVNRDVSRKIEAGASFPFLKKLFSGALNFSYSKDVDMTLTATKARNRLMNWTNFMEAVREGKIKQSLVDQIDSETPDFVIVAGDIILEGYKATITLNPDKDKELNRQFLDLSAKAPTKDMEFKLKVDNRTAGKYEVESTEPLVVARLILKPPTKRIRAENLPPLEQWTQVNPKEAVLQKLAEQRK